MATVVEPVPVRSLVEDQRLLLRGVSWATYVALGQDLELAHCHVRINYDNGFMELVMNSPRHERYSRAMIGIMDILSEELEVSLLPGGATTHQRADLGKGFEPDECFYIESEARMKGVQSLDLTIHPPPDLTFEVESSRSAIPRMPLFAAIGIPEVWRFNGEALTVHVFQEDGTYAISEVSPNFPGLPVSEIARFLRMLDDEGMDRLQWRRAFRDWVRQNVVPRHQAQAGDEVP